MDVNANPLPANPPPDDRRLLWVLGGGFSLTILFLIASGWLSIQAMQTVEERSEALLAEHRISTQVIDEIQGEEASLSDLFYELLSKPDPAQRAALLERLDRIQRDVGVTLNSARNDTNAELWTAATLAVEDFMTEVRRLVDPSLSSVGSTGESYDDQSLDQLNAEHKRLVGAISALVTANYRTAIDQERQEATSHRARLGQALTLLGIAVGLAVICAILVVRYVNRMYTRVAWQASELSRLSAYVLQAQEKMLQQFSRELHDEFGQSLTAIDANLAAVPKDNPETASRIEDCSLLVKDLMDDVRELSQLLRPSTLDDFGLRGGLQSLAESFGQRTGIAVEAHLSFTERLPREVETHLYRIAQEALTNVTRHSKASRVELTLEKHPAAGEERHGVRLVIADNGGGLTSSSERQGLGLAGMRERMRLCGGRLEIHSDSKGVTIVAEVTQDETAQWAETHPSPVGG